MSLAFVPQQQRAKVPPNQASIQKVNILQYVLFGSLASTKPQMTSYTCLCYLSRIWRQHLPTPPPGSISTFVNGVVMYIFGNKLRTHCPIFKIPVQDCVCRYRFFKVRLFGGKIFK